MMINGVLYAKDDPLPPPFGSGARKTLKTGIFEPQEKIVFKSSIRSADPVLPCLIASRQTWRDDEDRREVA
jgi:hypothetical protein